MLTIIDYCAIIVIDNKQERINRMLKFDADKKIAITAEHQIIIFWSEKKSGKSRTFTDQNGDKVILYGDDGVWWEANKKEAPNCFYGAFWSGDFPWGSWCWAIRICKSTGSVKVQTITTDINPSGGLSTAEKWERDCLAFAP